MKKIVIALGGNALGKNALEQKEIVKKTAKAILDLYEQGNTLLVIHGNGPQVGMINNSFQKAKEQMPLPECTAMSQGYIGYHIQNAIQNEVNKRKLDTNVVTLISQTLVDIKDVSLKNPSKPIGSFYSKSEALKLAKENNWVVKEDANRGWRQVVPSPKPIGIVEEKTIQHLLNVPKTIVITGGGGGIPVFKEKNLLKSVDAVIDKDLTAAKIASSINADIFMILTAVDKIFLNFGKPNQKEIDNISLQKLTTHYDNNAFAKGSMKPKVKAVINFVNETGNDAYIADLSLIDKVLQRESGTKITKE